MISLTTTKLQLAFDGAILATGSAFFYEAHGRPFLVTNRHNLTGRDQNTGKPLDTKNGGIPNTLKFSMPKYERRGNNIEFTGQQEWNFELRWQLTNPPWLEHPALGDKADIVALDLLKHWKDSQQPVACVNTLPHSHFLSILPAGSVSVVGYPFGVSVNNHYPIWITGSIASEPNFDADGKPAMYIDCRTNKGASGSPVFSVLNGGTAPVDEVPTTNDMSMHMNFGNFHSAAFYVPVQRFLGIYSGRINANSDIGLLWREKAVGEVCQSGVPGRPVS